MKVTITYSCGHEGVAEVFGNVAERESKIKYFEQYGVCPNCYKAKKQSEETTFVNENGLPELEGSEKQISWANKIRRDMIGAFESEKPAIREGAGNDFADFLDGFTSRYYKKESASWWIGHREWRTFKKELLKEAVTEFKAK